MYRLFQVASAAGLFLMLLPAAGFSQQEKQSANSLTGCVDKQSGQYVLLNDRTMQPVADLEADGFPKEAFAKYVGQKVAVSGRSTPGDSRPHIQVRTIKMVSETCMPITPQ